MVPDILNYKLSFLNPGLKLLMPLIFLYAAYCLYQSRQKYGGELGKVVRRLFVAALIGIFAMSFRYAADITTVLWKWGESLGLLALALANLFAVWPLLQFASGMPQIKGRSKPASQT
jgi:hypothetical protein